jgi:iron complex outermembrane receptor protein
VARGFRSPWYHELFANGFHEGTRAHETGNPNLRVETSANVDMGARIRLTALTIDAGVFSNRVRNFIYMQPIGAAGRRYDSLRVAQGDAWLRGVELDAQYRPKSWLGIEAGGDVTFGDNQSTGEHLPAIPAMRSLWALRLSAPWQAFDALDRTSLTLREERHWQQSRTHANDLATPAYTLHHLTVAMPFDFAGQAGTVDFVVRNVGDVRFRSFLSRYKEYADGLGRSIQLRVSLNNP